MNQPLQYGLRMLRAVILAVLVYGCHQEEVLPDQQFVIKNYSIPLDTNVRTTIFYQGHYFCLKESGRFTCLDQNLEVENDITKSINQELFDFAYVSRDTLIAGIYGNDTLRTITHYLNSIYKWEPLRRPVHQVPLFDDDRFRVTRCCFGEFGGAVFFNEKRTDLLYSYPATCPVALNKKDGYYYLTSSLAHLGGSTTVLRIGDPTGLYDITNDTLRGYCNWWIGLDGKNRNEIYEAQLTIDKPLNLESIHYVITLTSFIHLGQLFHISYDRSDNTFIGKFEGDSLIVFDSIYNEPLISHYQESQQYGSAVLYSFNNNRSSGFIAKNNDTIGVITYEIHD